MKKPPVPGITWMPMGPCALLFRFAEAANAESLDWSLAFSAELERDPPWGATDWIPTVTSILIEWGEPLKETSSVAEGLIRRLRNTEPIPSTEFPLHQIPVRYDGADLEEVAAYHGMSREEVVAVHCASEYRVCMLGFAPGFAYLGPLSPRLHTPRRKDPRPKVPAGSVAIGGEHTAVYPLELPGGWNLIGSTETSLFDPAQNDESAFLLKQGDRVRFIAL